jgi:hypothetical protein
MAIPIFCPHTWAKGTGRTKELEESCPTFHISWFGLEKGTLCIRSELQQKVQSQGALARELHSFIHFTDMLTACSCLNPSFLEPPASCLPFRFRNTVIFQPFPMRHGIYCSLHLGVLSVMEENLIHICLLF